MFSTVGLNAAGSTIHLRRLTMEIARWFQMPYLAAIFR
jgi:hypothetical protein